MGLVTGIGLLAVLPRVKPVDVQHQIENLFIVQVFACLAVEKHCNLGCTVINIRKLIPEGFKKITVLGCNQGVFLGPFHQVMQMGDKTVIIEPIPVDGDFQFLLQH